MKKNKDKIRTVVREAYGKIAGSEKENSVYGCAPDCCSPSDTAQSSNKDISSRMGYSDEELKNVPDGSNLGLGCGNPQAIASIKKGETILDLGSGAGFDVFLAAQHTGAEGKVIGVDMTPEMLSKAKENGKKGNYENVEFRLGEIEHLPVSDNSIDVIISNCVINLSPEKQDVFNEVFRVLKPGGRIAVSDIVATAEMPEEIKSDIELYTGCVAGASTIEELTKMLQNAGFSKINIRPVNASKEFIREAAMGHKISDYIISANIEAVKP